jgi:histidyl-tRNA synthetase
LKVANKEGIQLAVIIGQREIYEESVILRDLKGGLQETFPMAKVADEIKKRLKA